MTLAVIMIVCTGMALAISLLVCIISLTELNSLQRSLQEQVSSLHNFSHPQHKIISKLNAKAGSFSFFIFPFFYPFTLRRAGAEPGKGFADKSEQALIIRL